MRAYGEALDTKTVVITDTASHVASLSALTLQYVNRLEAARAAIEAGNGGGNSADVFAYLDFLEVGADEHPATLDNKAPNGVVYYSYGLNRGLGGKGDPYGPFSGTAIFSEGPSPDYANTAIVSASKISVPGPFTIGINARIWANSDGPVMAFTDNGTEDGPVHIVVFADPVTTTDKRSFRIYIQALGIVETIVTPEIDAMVLNSQKCHSAYLMRNPTTNKFEFKSNGAQRAESANAYVGTLLGYHVAWGNFRQADGVAESVYRSSLSFAYGARSVLYPGLTYTEPTTRPTL